MAFFEGPLNFHMGSWSRRPPPLPARTYEEDAERQETTNENRSRLCGLTHTRLRSVCTLALSPAGGRAGGRAGERCGGPRIQNPSHWATETPERIA